jgi:hypothetical protein
MRRSRQDEERKVAAGSDELNGGRGDSKDILGCASCTVLLSRGVEEWKREKVVA